METKNLRNEALEAELQTHLDIMKKLSDVKGCENSYFYINGYCHSWHVSALDALEAIGIARRGNHDELLFMIHQYGKAAPTPGWDLHKWCNPYRNEHILPDEVQEIIASRCNDEEIDAYISYQGFGLAGQRKFYAASTHAQRMRYLSRHGFLPEIQDQLRADGNQEEIDLHITRHGMHPGWEKDVLESKNSELFKHCVALHEFSILGQLLMCRIGSKADFLFYIEKWGLWNEVHAEMINTRSEAEIRQYIRTHRYLSFEGEKALLKRGNHDLIMFYISWKCKDVKSLLSAFGVNENGKGENILSDTINCDERVPRRNYVEIAFCLQRENMPETLKELEIFLMNNGNEDEITEYIIWKKPCPEAVQILLNRSLLKAVQTYCQKWMY